MALYECINTQSGGGESGYKGEIESTIDLHSESAGTITLSGFKDKRIILNTVSWSGASIADMGKITSITGGTIISESDKCTESGASPYTQGRYYIIDVTSDNLYISGIYVTCATGFVLE